MADGTLNRFLSRGTAAQRAAVTPSPPSPAAGPSPGYVWYETDTGLLYAYDGSGWERAGHVGADSPPVDGDFSWVNQGGASVVVSHGGIFLSAPADATNNRVRVKTAPAVPYTITALLAPLVISTSGWAGLYFRESGTGELQILFLRNGSVGVVNYADPTTFSSTPLADVALPQMGPTWLRIADDNTNRLFSVSTDGVNFVQVFSTPRTTFLTANQVGFGVHANATYAAGVTLLSWKQA